MLPERPIAEAMFGVPTPRDWDMFLEWSRLEDWRVPARELALYRKELADCAFVLRDGKDVPIGFITVCRHLHSAWIGNLIVAPGRRGEGFGRRLFAHAADMLAVCGATSLWLTASAAGKPLYASCGFRQAGRIERWSWQGDPAVARKPAPVGTRDLVSLTRADTAAWGDSRLGLLALLARSGSIFSSGSTIALLQPADNLNVLGPWLSADLCPRANRTVLTMAMEAVSGGGEMAVDVLGDSPMRILLQAAGFRQTGETLLMVRGESAQVKFNEIVALASLGSMG